MSTPIPPLAVQALPPKVAGEGVSLTIPTKILPPTFSLPADGLLSALTRSLPPSPTGAPVTALTVSLPTGNFSLKLPFALPEGVSVGLKATQNPQTGFTTFQLTSINGTALPSGLGLKGLPAFLKGLGFQTGQPNAFSSPLSQGAQGAQGAQNSQLPFQASGPLSNNAGQNRVLGLQAHVIAQPQSGGKAPLGLTPAALQKNGTPAQLFTGATLPPHLKGGLQQTPQGTLIFQKDGTLSVRLLNVSTSENTGNTASATRSTATGLVLTGRVLQSTSMPAQSIINTPMGRLALSGVSLPLESTVTLDVIDGSKKTAIKTDQAPSLLHREQALKNQWPALEDSLETLKALQPQTSETLLNQLIPKPDHRLLANMVFFLKAMGRGNFKDWSDDTSNRILSRQKPDLMGALEKDFTQLSERANPQNPNDWRIFFMPMQHQNQLEQIQVAIRKDQDQDNPNPDEKPDVRFVFDITLSALGPMQFDGLTKQPTQQFDLIIRTHEALPAEIRRSIHEIYSNALGLINYQGKLTYQVTPTFLKVDNDITKPDARALGLLI